MALIQRGIYDGTTIDISITDVKGNLVGVESVSYGHSLDVQKVKGTGQTYRGYTNGILNAENGSLTLWVSELNNWLESVGGVYPFHNLTFDVTITYRTVGIPLQTVVLQGCRAINVSHNYSLNTSDNLTATVDFMVLDVVVNGKGIIGKAIQEAVGILRSTGIF
jgi:hypothetical protein